jgi:hypothetical protein
VNGRGTSSLLHGKIFSHYAEAESGNGKSKKKLARFNTNANYSMHILSRQWSGCDSSTSAADSGRHLTMMSWCYSNIGVALGLGSVLEKDAVYLLIPDGSG